MNKNAYRTLFSHASGTFIAVAENTRNRGKGATGGNTPVNDSFPLMRFALLSVLVAAAFGQVTTVHAQMIAYKNGGPAPIIDRAGNGVPVVQIVQPNGSGLSHNRYTDFNVDRNGVILNNSPTSVNTTLSGYIQGNAQINTGANVILNETLGVSPSHLNGYIEVAGQRADVIIANPNGLSVNGFGVINGGNVTLTTGVAQFGGDGSLAAYRVTRGQIAVDGDGINALQNDSLSLISRSVAFNAQLQARNLGFVTGANSVTPDMTGIEVIQGDGEQPTVAIDSSALGGLYAQKIKLVGTEAGVGVRTYGDMASSGDFVLDSAGKVSLNGKTHAGGQMTIRSNDDIDNTGTLYAQRASINSTGQVVNSGTMASQSDLSVVANSINSTGILAAGIDANGQATQAGNLVLNANGQLTATGQNTAGNNVTMTGASVNLTGAHTSANGATTLTATNGDILHAGGNIQAAGGTVLQATGTVVNDHGVINTSSFNSTSGAFSNISGSVTQSGTSDTNIITSGITNNTSGVIATNANNSNLQSASFMNDAGVVTQAGGGALTINSGAISNVNGRIATNGALLLTGTSLNNSRGSLIANRDAMLKLSGDLRNTQGTLQAANALTASAATIDNTAGRITSLDASRLSLDASGVLRNIAGTTADGAQGGVIGGNGDVALTAANAINSGSITAGNNLSAHIGNQLNNDGGRLAAANTLALQAALLSNAQGALDAAKVSATITQLNNNNGKINADKLNIHATNLSNQGGHIAQFGKDASIIDVTDTLDNANGGVIQTNSTDLTLTPRQLNNNGGTISLAGQGALTIDVGESALQNAGGTIGSNGATQVHAGSVHNAGGSVFGAGATTITARNGDIDNSNSGYLGGDSLALQAFAQFNNVSGKAEAMKNGFTVHANSLNNAGGTIQNLGTSALTIALQQGLNNSAADGVGGFIGSAGSAAIHAADIGNADGTIYTKDDLLLNADNVLNNNAGVIQSDNALVAHAGQAILNQNGRIEANGAGATLTLSGASIDNSAGRIANSGSGATTINSAGNIANDAGTIGGNGNVTLAANYLTNTQGHVISANDLTLAIANSINNAQGSLYAARHLKANHANATFNNNAGKVSAGGDIALTLASLDNTNGQIGNTAGDGGNIALSTSGNVTNAAGNIGSDNNTTINANTIIGEGKVIAGQDATINLQGDYTNTVGNTFTANRDLHVSTTGTLTNAGNLEALRHLGLSAANVTNQYGALINAGNGNTVIRASNAVYNLGRIYGDDVAIGAQTMTNDGIFNSDGSTYQAGVIAARNDLTIGAHTILNREHATLQSLNNMVLGGALDVENKAIGNAASIINASATIDAGNDLTFQTATLTNQNNHFTTHLVIDPAQTRRVTQYRAYGSDIWYNADQITWSDSGDGGIVLVLPDGNRFEKFYKQDYTQIVQKTTVTSSDPGNITAGRHMTLSGDVTNDKSTIIAGGTLGGQVGNITNLGAPGEITTTNEMTAGHNYYHWVDGHPHQNHYIYDNNGEAYDVNLPSQQFTLPVWTVLDLTKPNQGDNGAVGTGVDNNTVPAGDNSTIGGNQGGHDLVGDGQTVGAADGAAGGNTGTSGTPQTVGKPGVPLPNISIGNNQLFPIVQNPHSPFLVETDPKFTNYKNFISSDYLLGRLGIDPMTTQKRLGDGFYEQKLINDQITELTGKRFLGTFATNEEQYQALMDSGVASAEQFQLTPGIALTAAQMAALTTDIVWLVSQNVALPDGSTQSVLVPVVYLARVDANDVSPTGAVMSGRNIDLSINGTLDNGGTLQASNNTLIHATDIHNTGTLRSDAKTGTTMLVADNDLINNGGSIAGNRVGILAGRDVSMESITSSASSKNGVNVGISKVASVSADQLSIQSGRDINLKGTAITTTGDAAMIAGRDLNLGTVTTQATSNVTYGDHNHLNEYQTQANGTSVQSGGNVTMAAGQDMNANAAYVNADKALGIAAGRDINIQTAQQISTKDQEISTTSKGLFSSSSYHMTDKEQGTQSVGSTFSGDTVQMAASRDINVTGSNVVGTHDVTIVAGNNVNIISSQNTASQSTSTEDKTSGMFSSGGFGVTMGTKEQQNAQTSKQLTHNSSTVGSTDGNIVISAGNAYTQTGSNVATPKGDIGIMAKSVDINAAIDTDSGTQDTKFKQGGVTVTATNAIVSAIQTGQQMHKASKQVDDPRLKALAAATTGIAAANAAEALSNGTASAVNVSISLGSSQSKSHSQQSTTTALGSTVAAGGNTTIIATGGGKDSNINVIGSTISAGNNVSLIADNAINLEAARNTATQQSTNSSSSASVGIGFSLGGQSNGFTLNAGVSGGRGNADGSDVSYTNTHVTAGNQLNLISGGDTNIKGAVVSANKVLANVGGDLNIESLQNTSTYTSKQQSVGVAVSLCIPPFCYGASSASGNFSNTNMNSNYASVVEQSGIKTGDGGFDVNVKGNTNLVGGVIASTDKAVQDAKNSFTTGGLTQSDIQNHATYSGQSVSLGGGYSFGGSTGNANGVGKDQQGDAQAGSGQTPGTTLPSKNGLAVGVPIAMSAKGDASSTTQSGISGISGNAAARTGDDESGIAPIFDAQKIQAAFDITQAFGNQVSTYVNTKMSEADKMKQDAADPKADLTPDQRQQLRDDASAIESSWGAGSTNRQIANALTAAASGNVTGGSAQFIQAGVVSYIQQQGAGYIGKLVDSGALTEGSPEHAALHAIVACAGGAASSESCGAGAMGAAASSLLSNLFTDTPNETNVEKDTKGNLVKNLVTGLAAMAGNNASTANSAATAAVDNNWLTPKQNIEKAIAQRDCAGGNSKACGYADELNKFDAETKKQLDHLVDACSKGAVDACGQAQQVAATRTELAKEQIDSCASGSYSCIDMYQPSAEEVADALRQIPDAGSGAIVATMDPVTAAILLRYGAMTPVASTVGAVGGGAGEFLNQTFQSDASYDYTKITYNALAGWATAPIAVNTRLLGNQMLSGFTNGAVTSYNNSQQGSNDSVGASIIWGVISGGAGYAAGDIAKNAASNFYRTTVGNPAYNKGLAALLQGERPFISLPNPASRGVVYGGLAGGAVGGSGYTGIAPPLTSERTQEPKK